VALQKQQKILACFSEGKLSIIYLGLQIQKVSMHRVSFWSISECINLFFIVVFDFLNCPQSEKMDLKITQSLLERVRIYKRCRTTEEFGGPK